MTIKLELSYCFPAHFSTYTLLPSHIRSRFHKELFQKGAAPQNFEGASLAILQLQLYCVLLNCRFGLKSNYVNFGPYFSNSNCVSIQIDLNVPLCLPIDKHRSSSFVQLGTEGHAQVPQVAGTNLMSLPCANLTLTPWHQPSLWCL